MEIEAEEEKKKEEEGEIDPRQSAQIIFMTLDKDGDGTYYIVLVTKYC